MAITPEQAFELIGGLVHVAAWPVGAEHRDDDWYAFDGWLLELKGQMPDLLATVRNDKNWRVIDEIPLNLISVVKVSYGM
jgi:hypothetical protein